MGVKVDPKLDCRVIGRERRQASIMGGEVNRVNQNQNHVMTIRGGWRELPHASERFPTIYSPKKAQEHQIELIRKY